MGPIGLPEMIFIFVLALLIFGPRKLPELGRSLGKAMTEFRRASNDLRRTMEEEMREVERTGNEIMKPLSEAAGEATGEATGYGPIAPEQPPDAPASAGEKPADDRPESA